MIVGIIILLTLVSITLLRYISNENFQIPDSIYSIIILGTIISFILFGLDFINVHILDFKHPIYSSEGISTVSWILSITGGLIISIPFSIIWIIQWNKNTKRRG